MHMYIHMYVPRASVCACPRTRTAVSNAAEERETSGNVAHVHRRTCAHVQDTCTPFVRDSAAPTTARSHRLFEATAGAHNEPRVPQPLSQIAPRRLRAARSIGAARYELKDAPFPRARARSCARPRDREFRPVTQEFRPVTQEFRPRLVRARALLRGTGGTSDAVFGLSKIVIRDIATIRSAFVNYKLGWINFFRGTPSRMVSTRRNCRFTLIALLPYEQGFLHLALVIYLR